jgi:hypothetical protein
MNEPRHIHLDLPLSGTLTACVQKQFDTMNVTFFNWFASQISARSLQERHTILRSILSNCRPVDLSFIHSYVTKAPSLRVDFVAELPGELAFLILTHLYNDPVSLVRAARVSKTWHRIIQDNDFWRQLCNLKQWKANAVHHAIMKMSSRRCLPFYNNDNFWYPLYNLVPLCPPWKAAFMDHYVRFTTLM